MPLGPDDIIELALDEMKQKMMKKAQELVDAIALTGLTAEDATGAIMALSKNADPEVMELAEGQVGLIPEFEIGVSTASPVSLSLLGRRAGTLCLRTWPTAMALQGHNRR